MITIVTGSVLADIHEYVKKEGAMVFEDYFVNHTWFKYDELWAQIHKDATVICKTRDAITCAPEDTTVAIVGRSIRNSDRGSLVANVMPLEHFKMIYG